MFNLGGAEALVILLVALLVLGPTRLPEAARHAGKVLTEVRRVSTGFQRELKTAFETGDQSGATPPPPAAPAAAAVGDEAT